VERMRRATKHFLSIQLETNLSLSEQKRNVRSARMLGSVYNVRVLNDYFYVLYRHELTDGRSGWNVDTKETSTLFSNKPN
jgi:hypothetical protein